MLHEIKNRNQVIISESVINIEYLKTKDFFPKEYSTEINNCEILLIPYEGFKDRSDLFFPELTREFLKFAKDQGLNAEICISNDNFQILELHSNAINIPKFIVASIVLPVAINLISNFLQSEINKKRENLSTKIEIVIEKDNVSKSLVYEGSAKEFKTYVQPFLENIFDEEK